MVFAVNDAAGVLRAANVNAFTTSIISRSLTGTNKSSAWLDLLGHEVAARSKLKSGSLQRSPDSVPPKGVPELQCTTAGQFFSKVKWLWGLSQLLM
jgi:hypothetical protein